MKKLLHVAVYLLFFQCYCNFLPAQTFIGSEACADCHALIFSSWESSGHAARFLVSEDNQPPVFSPEVINFQEQWMDSLGDGSHDWGQIAAVVGGYGWKTRFIGTDGMLIGTASSTFPDAGLGHNQHNFYEGNDYGWSDYNDTVSNDYFNYSCFKCHVTAADTSGTWLPGVTGLGSFAEEGTGCESCHGPGSVHVSSGGSYNKIYMVYEFAHQDNATGGLTIGDELLLPDLGQLRVNFLCGTCHNRGYSNQIQVSNGFVMHHQQWSEFVSNGHYESGITCSDCHNPHKRVIWEGDGISGNCEQCHTHQAEVTNHSAGPTCVDCHMPFSSFSGAERGQSEYVADIRSHLFKIIPDTASMFTADGKWVRNDEERPAALSPAFACLGCHNHDPDDEIFDKTLEQAVATARGIHTITYISEQGDLQLGVYPNPTTGPLKINFSLARAQNVNIEIYNVSGQIVYEENEVNPFSGNQIVDWNGTSNTGVDIQAGYYFVKVSAGHLTSVKKVVLMK